MELILQENHRINESIYFTGTLTCKDYTAIFVFMQRSGYEIPPGTYKTSYTYSPKFGSKLYLLDVPQRQGIRIHSGNTYKDTTGCVLIGTHRINDMLMNSSRALERLKQLTQGNLSLIKIKYRNETNFGKICRKVLNYFDQLPRKSIKS